LGNRARGNTPSDRELAVAFYKHGELLKSYSTKDLVCNPMSVETTVSHYRWILWASLEPTWEKTFGIITTDSIQYIFDVATGEIASERKLQELPPR
jgi:hypothetical protein